MLQFLYQRIQLFDAGALSSRGDEISEFLLRAVYQLSLDCHLRELNPRHVSRR